MHAPLHANNIPRIVSLSIMASIFAYLFMTVLNIGLFESSQNLNAIERSIYSSSFWYGYFTSSLGSTVFWSILFFVGCGLSLYLPLRSILSNKQSFRKTLVSLILLVLILSSSVLVLVPRPSQSSSSNPCSNCLTVTEIDETSFYTAYMSGKIYGFQSVSTPNLNGVIGTNITSVLSKASGNFEILAGVHSQAVLTSNLNLTIDKGSSLNYTVSHNSNVTINDLNSQTWTQYLNGQLAFSTPQGMSATSSEMKFDINAIRYEHESVNLTVSQNGWVTQSPRINLTSNSVIFNGVSLHSKGEIFYNFSSFALLYANSPESYVYEYLTYIPSRYEFEISLQGSVPSSGTVSLPFTGVQPVEHSELNALIFNDQVVNYTSSLLYQPQWNKESHSLDYALQSNQIHDFFIDPTAGPIGQSVDTGYGTSCSASFCIFTNNVSSTQYYYALAGLGQSTFAVGAIAYGGSSNAGGATGTKFSSVFNSVSDLSVPTSIFMTPEKFVLDAPISWGSRVMLYGAGEYSTLIQASSSYSKTYMFTQAHFSSSYVDNLTTFENFAIDGNGIADPFMINEPLRWSWFYVQMVGAKAYAINDTGSQTVYAGFLSIIDCDFIHHVGDGSSNNQNPSIGTFWSSNMVFEGNNVGYNKDDTKWALVFQGNQQNVVGNNFRSLAGTIGILFRNSLYNTFSSNAVLTCNQVCLQFSSDGNTVSGNTFIDGSQDANLGYYSVIIQSNNNTFSGNLIYNESPTKSKGLQIYSGEARNSVSGNTFGGNLASPPVTVSAIALYNTVIYNSGYNPQGFSATQLISIVSGSYARNNNPYPVYVYLISGTISAASINATSVSTSGPWYLPPNYALALTNSSDVTTKTYGT